MADARALAVAALACAAMACSANAPPPTHGSPIDADFLVPIDASFPSHLDAGRDSAATGREAAAPDASPDAPPSRFITEVLSFHQGTCAGYGASSLPGVVEGPPVGGGSGSGSPDVVSLGGGGSIVVGFGPNSIVDGDGIDFVVFENPFDYGVGQRYVEPGEVSVSEDGATWTAFPCTDTTQAEPDGGWGATRCGGMNLVFSNPDNGISPFDLQRAGGDQYDLAWIGVKRAKYVRVRNVVASEWCEDAGSATAYKNGFDLDAIAIIHPALP